MSLEKIKRRKEELQAEIDRIEDNYISKASNIERKVKSVLRPVHNIRQKPFTTVGISVAVGFVIGYLRKKKSSKSSTSRKYKESSPSEYDGKSDTGFTTLLMAELQRLAAQRAMMYVSDLIDKRLNAKDSNSNDSKKSQGESDQKVAIRK